MKNIFITISMLFSLIVYAQAPTYEVNSFAGRYVKWASTQSYCPNGTTTLVTDIQQFWSEPFYIDVYVHQNITSIGDDVEDMIDEWNANSNLARMIYSGDISGVVSASYSPRNNKVFKDDFGVFYPTGGNYKGMVLAVTQHWGVYTDCENPNWNKGPVLLGGNIGINPDEDLYSGNVPDVGYFSLQAIVLHELGHLLGLNHLSNRLAVMNRALERNKPKGIHEDDRNAINRLYGYDGFNNTPLSNPLYNSILCSDFDYEIEGLIGINDDGTYTYVQDSDDCLNCIADVSEDGIDCGGSCPNECMNICNLNTWSCEYVNDNPIDLPPSNRTILN